MMTVSRSSCFWSGVLSASVLLSRSAMLPIWVAMPVAVTMNSPHHAGDHGVHEGHVVLVAQRHFLFLDGRFIFGRRHALAGKGGLLDLEGCGDEEPAIGGNTVARLHQHDIAGASPSASISTASPSRRTRAMFFIILVSSAMLASALASPRSPRTALKRVRMTGGMVGARLLA